MKARFRQVRITFAGVGGLDMRIVDLAAWVVSLTALLGCHSSGRYFAASSSPGPFPATDDESATKLCWAATGQTCSLCSGTGKQTCEYCHGADKTKLTCEYCHGVDQTKLTCEYCHGVDQTKLPCEYCNGLNQTTLACTTCSGSGKYGGRSCFSCRGTGKRPACIMCRGSGKRPTCVMCRGSGKRSTCVMCRGRGQQSACVMCRGSAARGSICRGCDGHGIIEVISARYATADELLSAVAANPAASAIVPATWSSKPLLVRDGQDRIAAQDGSYFGQISEATGRPKVVFVNGYLRKDGTYVASHYRSLPSASGNGYSSLYRSASTPPLTFRPYVAENGSYYGEISDLTGRPKTVHVRGYYRKDGTYVQGYYRSSPRR